MPLRVPTDGVLELLVAVVSTRQMLLPLKPSHAGVTLVPSA
jgi:hypothetical protein